MINKMLETNKKNINTASESVNSQVGGLGSRKPIHPQPTANVTNSLEPADG